MLSYVLARPDLRLYTAGAVMAAFVAVGLVALLVGTSGVQHRRAPASDRAAARGSTSARSPVSSRPRAGRPVPASHGSPTPVNRVASTIMPAVPDPYQAESHPAPASVRHAAAVSPASAGEKVAAGAPSDAEVSHALAQMRNVLRAPTPTQLPAKLGGAVGAIAASGALIPRAGIPQVVAQVIAGGNAIADFPYVYGGGHTSFVDNAYDCSASVSYALAAAGLVSAPETSGQLESWGAAGPGKWITVYANAGHTFMVIDGLRFDTVGRSGTFGTRWQVAPPPEDTSAFVARHWPGL
jgi:cell wall-associated NlpC family hydrolase